MRSLVLKRLNPFLNQKKNHAEILLYYRLILKFKHPVDVTEMTPSFMKFLKVAMGLDESQRPRNGSGKGNNARRLRRK